MKGRLQAGFGLLETVIAMGVATVLALGIMSMNNVLFKAQKSAQTEADWITLQGSIQQILASDTACGVAFRPANNPTARLTLNMVPFAAANPPAAPTAPPQPGTAVPGETPIGGIYLGTLNNPIALAVAGNGLGNTLKIVDLRLLPVGQPSGMATANAPGTATPTQYTQTTYSLFVKVQKNGTTGAVYGSPTLDNFNNMPVVTVLSDNMMQIVHCGSSALVAGAGPGGGPFFANVSIGQLQAFNGNIVGCPTAGISFLGMTNLNQACSGFCQSKGYGGGSLTQCAYADGVGTTASTADQAGCLCVR